MTLVNRLPGPSTTRSASSGSRRRRPVSARGPSGRSATRRMRLRQLPDRRLAVQRPSRPRAPPRATTSSSRHGQDAADRAQHAARDLDRLEEAAGLLGERGQDQVAQVVAAELAVAVVAVLEQRRDRSSSSDSATRQLRTSPGGGSPRAAAQPPGAAAVVAHRHDRGQRLDVAAERERAQAARPRAGRCRRRERRRAAAGGARPRRARTALPCAPGRSTCSTACRSSSSRGRPG